MNNSIKNKKEEKWQLLCDAAERLGGDGEGIVTAMKKLYSHYSNDVLVWLGGLFDTRIGGFYYSASAKNSDGYLPDVESTYQAIVLLQRLGVISSYDKIPESVRRKIAGFICSLEDPDNGYFYHPQWSRDLTDSKNSRKGRDLTWAIALSSWLDFKFPYPDAATRRREINRKASAVNSDIFSSKESFEKYLEGLDFGDDILKSVHVLVSQADQIRAAGLSDVALEFLNNLQNEENGLLSGKANSKTVYAFYGISGLYKSVFKTKLPASRRVAEIILSEYLCDGANFPVSNVFNIRNLWGIIENIIDTLKDYGDEADRLYADEIKSRLLKNAPSLITYTAESIAKFKRPTGAFSLFEQGSPTTSQGVPVAPENTQGGDVNATAISVGMITSIYHALGLADCKVELFEPEDFCKFVYTIESNS